MEPEEAISRILEALAAAGPLEPEKRAEVACQLAQAPALVAALTEKLISGRRLTHYQADSLLAGNGGELLMDNYLLLERLGQGGMGEVFKARDRSTKEVVALKVMREDWRADPEALKRFKREFQLLSRCRHTHIVSVRAAGRDRDRDFFTMEYIDGTDLHKLVRRTGPLPWEQASRYVYQAALGLEAIHQHGLVHRDLKPANLLRAKADGCIKILDMGLGLLCRPAGDVPEDRFTRAGIPMGTRGFISPEQSQDAHRVDIRSDLYSLGCTLYFLLCGRVPMPTSTLLPGSNGEGWPDLPRDLPEELRRIIARLIAWFPEQRFQTPAGLADALSPWAAAGRAAEPVGGPSAPGEAANRRPESTLLLQAVSPPVA